MDPSVWPTVNRWPRRSVRPAMTQSVSYWSPPHPTPDIVILSLWSWWRLVHICIDSLSYSRTLVMGFLYWSVYSNRGVQYMEDCTHQNNRGVLLWFVYYILLLSENDKINIFDPLNHWNRSDQCWSWTWLLLGNWSKCNDADGYEVPHPSMSILSL